MAEQYYYGVGQVRSLETKLIDPAQFARLAAAADFAAAFAVLSETPYAAHLPRLKQAFDLEELCQLELLDLKKLLDRLAPAEPLLNVYFLRYDYLNLKLLLRARLAGQKEPPAFSRAGTRPPAELERLAAAIPGAIEGTDPAKLDQLLDRHYFARFSSVGAEYLSPLVRQVVQAECDLTNLITVLRARLMKQEKKALPDALVATGAIDQPLLLELFSREPSEWPQRLLHTPYLPRLAAGLEEFARSGSFTRLEKALADFQVELFRQARYFSSGVEPLLGYLLAKQNELNDLRFILVGKLNNVPAERLKERLSVCY